MNKLKATEINYETDYDEIADKEDSNLSLLNDKYKVVANDINVLKNGGKELQNKLAEAVINAVGLVNFKTGEPVGEVSLIPSENKELEIYTTDKVNEIVSGLEAEISENKDDIAENKSDIAQNTANIGTISAQIEASYSTTGTYTSPAGDIQEADGEARVQLTAIEALNPDYIEVSVSPEQNNFKNLQDGKVVFTITIENLINDENDKTLYFKIYKNGTIFKTLSWPIGASQEISKTIIGQLDVLEGDEVYFTYSITGLGLLSTDNPITYYIQVSGEGITSNKSSLIIDDYDTQPTLGINPWKAIIDDLQARVATLENQNTDSVKLKVGSIIICPLGAYPNYGTWTDLGVLNDGQAIIGGSTTDGKVQSHTHTLISSDGDGGTFSAFDLGSINADGTQDTSAGSLNVQPPDGANDRNRAYGRGIGSDNHLYKRTA